MIFCHRFSCRLLPIWFLLFVDIFAWGDAIDSLPSTPLPAPDSAPPWSITSFAESAKLNHRTVFSLAFQSNGIIWAAASDGLYRYDGYHWKVYRKESGLPSDFIRSVAVTRNDAVWVGTDQGAGIFNGTKFDRKGSERGLAGPSVRRITETSDGAIWFSSDPWPDASAPAGVSRFYQGRWKTWKTNDGLASDHVFDVVARKNQPIYACTLQGISEFKGDRWETVFQTDARYSPATPWEVAIHEDGSVIGFLHRSEFFAFRSSGEAHFKPIPLRFRDLQGVEHSPTNGYLTEVLVTQSETGEVYGLLRIPREGVVVARFQAGSFQQISPAFPKDWEWPEDFKMAPDGSFWVCGFDFLFRWVPGGEGWHRYSTLPIAEPIPRLIDHQGRVWISGDEGNSLVLQGDRVRVVHGFGSHLRLDGKGTVWGWADNGPLHASFDPDRNFSPKSMGLQTVFDVKPDSAGRAWAVGSTTNETIGLAIFEDHQWHPLDLEKLLPSPGGFGLTEIEPNPAGGMWGIVTNDSGYGIMRLDANQATLLFFAKDTKNEIPSLAPGNVSDIWLRTLSRLYRFNADSSNLVEETGIKAHASIVLPLTNTLGCIFESGGGGIDGYGFLVSNRWTIKECNIEERPAIDLVLAQRQASGWPIHLLFHEAIAILSPTDLEHPRLVSLPSGTPSRGVVADLNDVLWVGTQFGLLRQVLGTHPPLTEIGLTNLEFREDRPIPLPVNAVEWRIPRGTPRHDRFSWRWDGGPFCGPEELPPSGLPMGIVGKGTHQLEIKAVDESGNEDAQPRQVVVRITGTPIQERLWFTPAVTALFALLSILSLSTMRVNRRMAEQKAHLEEIVAARTRELFDQTEMARSLAIEAVESSRAKSEFLSTVSHELRTPLSGFLGFVHLLQETHLDGEQLGYLELIKKSGDEAFAVIARILNFERLQKDRASVSRDPFNIEAVCRETLEWVRPVAQRKKLQLILESSPEAPSHWNGDVGKVRQVLRELVSNAVKFSKETTVPASAVTISIHIAQPEEMVVTVRDNGMGIPAEHRDLLFRPFSQGDGTASRSVSGLGLGLAISRELVVLMGGRIGYESKEGQGTQFWFTLPKI